MLHESIAAQRAGARFAAAAFTYLMMHAAWSSGGYTEAYDTAREGLAMAEGAGDTLGALGLRIALSSQAMLVGHEDEALQLAHQALAEAQQLHQPTLEAAALYTNGLALARSDPPRAIAVLYETLALTRRLELDSERTSTLGLLAALEAQHGVARRSLEAIREQLVAHNFSRFFVTSNFYIGTGVFNRIGRPDLVAKCEGHCQQIGLVAPMFYAELHEFPIRTARAALGEQAYDRHAAEGAAIPPEEFNDVMLEEIDDLLADMPPV
jgi:hypothetical protein